MSKVLSIKQPWASLIVHGIKDIENRTWPTKYRGRVYIHASAKQAGIIQELLTLEQIQDWSKNSFLNMNIEYPKTAIIGYVTIVDCVIGHSSVWAEKAEKGEKPIYNWVLENAVIFSPPIQDIKGKLGIWNIDDELLKR